MSLGQGTADDPAGAAEHFAPAEVIAVAGRAALGAVTAVVIAVTGIRRSEHLSCLHQGSAASLASPAVPSTADR